MRVARTLNLGILAHVDAGKTTLTERLLYTTGVIDALGSVDDGTTQTDSLALERQRGITIKSAVATFAVDDVVVNIIDTPGHPDFIAEVERALGVLDGAVLVISAVEGVQPQTRVLWRALQRLRVPTLFFVNKMDRVGADAARVQQAIAQRLTSDEHPILFGSAITGAGIDELLAALVTCLPVHEGDPDGPVSGRVFKVERGRAGERVAYLRMFSGALKVRDRVNDGKVTSIEVFTETGLVRGGALTAGHIGKVGGLGDIRVGDTIGIERHDLARQFEPPTLETVVVPTDPAAAGALRAALAQLAEQDPLIDVRQHDRDDPHDEIRVSLYGEVQKEVIATTLATDFGIAVTFRPTTVVHIERVLGTGAAVELLQHDSNPYSATVGLRVEPAPLGSGIQFQLDVDTRTVPTYIYRTHDSFIEHMTLYVRRSLAVGLHGWQVTDCIVTMTDCGYYVGDGPRKPTRPMTRTAAADFRKLTPRVLKAALTRARTVVCEPIMRARVETPSDSLGTVLALLARLGAAMGAPAVRGELSVVDTTLPAARAQELRARLPGITSGEATVETELAGYEPVRTTRRV